MRFPRSRMITKIIVLALIIYAVISLISTRTQIDNARAQQNELRMAVARQELSNADLAYKIENYNEPNVIADIARSSLGLVLPGEMVFYDSGVENAP